MKKTVLREYAKLIVRCGVNVQKGQEVLIFAELDQPEFVKLVVEEAYKAKAKKVTVEWDYQPLAKLHVRYQSVKTMGTVTDFQKARQQHYCDTLPARIHIISEDPDGLKGMNMEKMAKARKMSYPILKPYIDQREGNQQWCIAAVPGAAVEETPMCLCRKIVRWSGSALSLGRMLVCLDIFCDVGLIQLQRMHKYISIRLTPGAGKADLNQSQTMQHLLQMKES